MKRWRGVYLQVWSGRLLSSPLPCPLPPLLHQAPEGNRTIWIAITHSRVHVCAQFNHVFIAFCLSLMLSVTSDTFLCVKCKPLKASRLSHLPDTLARWASGISQSQGEVMTASANPPHLTPTVARWSHLHDAEGEGFFLTVLTVLSSVCCFIFNLPTADPPAKFKI